MTRWIQALLLALTLAVAVAPPPSVQAQETIEAAKAAGFVGERPDGLLGIVVDSAPPAVKALVERINRERLERYRSVAQKNATSVDKVQAVAGAELIQRTPSGQYVMNAAGRWLQK